MSDQNATSESNNSEQIKFGKILKKARLEKKLSLQDVSSDLKINLKTLRNLEESNIEQLPKRAFTKGFIKTYAKYLGVLETDVINLFDSHFESNTHLVQTGVLRRSDSHETVFMSDVIQKTIIPFSILFLTIAGVFIVSLFLKSYNPSPTFNNTTKISETMPTANESIPDQNQNTESLANINTEESINKINNGKESDAKALASAGKKESTLTMNTLTVEPLDKTALSIKTNLDEKFIRARLNPNKPRTFKFESAEVTFYDAGAVNILFNGKDIGVPGNFGEQKLVRYPSEATQ